MACPVEIHNGSAVLPVDGVSFNAPFNESSIESGHPHGPVFSNGAAKAVISEADAAMLIAAGVIDRR
ncbi:hypothetical protein JTM69_36025 [Pseudomonas aeruginosa]|nr:hypothetical protein [Pseudomonas aeruginosa]